MPLPTVLQTFSSKFLLDPDTTLWKSHLKKNSPLCLSINSTTDQIRKKSERVIKQIEMESTISHLSLSFVISQNLLLCCLHLDTYISKQGPNFLTAIWACDSNLIKNSIVPLKKNNILRNQNLIQVPDVRQIFLLPLHYCLREHKQTYKQLFDKDIL